MDHEQKLNDVFAKVKTQAQSSSFQETQALFLASQGNQTKISKQKRFTLKKLLMMIGIIGLITSVAMFFGTQEEGKAIEKKKEQKEMSVQVEDEIEQISEVVKVSLPERIKEEQVGEGFTEETEVWEHIPAPVGFVIPKHAPRKMPHTDLDLDKDLFIFPVLTEKEIIATKKQKNKMLKGLAKMDKDQYKYIPAGSFTYKGKKVSVQSFIMQKSEVTNLEYRTFLFDLLIQGRKSEFKIAAPSQEKWTTLLGKDMQYMQDNYFSDDDHIRFPVCNVSPKGAEMYCKWLTLELDQSDYKKRMKMRLNDVRLPQRVEWVKAVSEEGKKLPYPWGDDKIADEFGFFYANFKLPLKDTANYLVTDSTSVTTLGSLLGKNNILLYAGFHREHEKGLYNTCGNVAELVHETDISNSDLTMGNNKTYGTAGGGWMNTAEEIKILNEDLHKDIKEGHPNVGFRVVMTYTGNYIPLIGTKGN